MTTDRQRRIEGLIALVFFGLSIPAANWLIERFDDGDLRFR